MEPNKIPQITTLLKNKFAAFVVEKVEKHYSSVCFGKGKKSLLKGHSYRGRFRGGRYFSTLFDYIKRIDLHL